MKKTKTNTYKLVLLALLTAVVVVLQILAIFMRTGTFAISLVSVPIVLGAILLGPLAGTWLGVVFGVVVLLSGDANAFLAVNFPATIAVVVLKGALCGLASGLVYKIIKNKNDTAATVAAAVVNPIVNTGIFVIGGLIFFLPFVTGGATELTFASVVTAFSIFIGVNFIVELLITAVLSPVIVRLTKMPQITRRLKK